MTAREKCAATVRRTGERCGRWPLRGSSVCTSHGAAAGQVRRAAKRRQDEQRVREMVGRLLHDENVAPLTDPYYAGMKLAAVIANAVSVLGARVNELETLDATDDKGAERTRTTVSVYKEMLALSLKATTELARLDLDEKHLRLDAARAAAIVAVLEAGVRAAGLDDVQAWRFRESVRAGLNELERGA